MASRDMTEPTTSMTPTEAQGKPPPWSRRAVALDLALLAGLWLIAILLVNPHGNFPLIDDWIYAPTVHSIMLGLGPKLKDWGSATLVAQTYWGALFCSVFGFSFTTLRLSTLVLGLAGVYGTYGLARVLGATRFLAVVCALALAFNPLYFNLSFSFMTDVPFAAMAVLSILLVVVGIQRRAGGTILLGAVGAAVATLIRQLGLVMPLAFAFSTLLSRPRARQLAVAGAFCALATLPLVAWNWWLGHVHGVPALYGLQAGEVMHRLAQGPAGQWHDWLLNAFVIGMYAGLFALPVLAVKSRGAKVRDWVFLATAPLFILGALDQRRLMPYSYDCLGNNTIGPLFLAGRDYLIPKPLASVIIWSVLTLAAALAAASLISLLVGLVRGSLGADRRAATGARIRLFLAFCAVIYAAPLVIGGFFDRYLILLAPLMAAAICAAEARAGAGKVARWRIGAACLVLAGFATFSVAGTHDYLAWNRARWQALDHLTEVEHIRPDRIDGGFEYNGAYYLTPENLRRYPTAWVVPDDYTVSFRPLPGKQVHSVWPYSRWLPPMRDQIYVLTHTLPKSP